MTNRINKIAFLCLIAFIFLIIWTILMQPYNNGPAIRSDGVGYHLWAHAIASSNYTFCENKDALLSVGAISNISEQNVCMNKYPPGVGLMQYLISLPFTQYILVDGQFSEIDHLMVLYIGGGLLVASLLLIFFVLRLQDYNTGHILIALVLYTFGTGVFHYATYDASFSHIYSFFGFSALIFISNVVAKRLRWTPYLLGLYAVLVFWLILVRQTNVILTIYPLIVTLLYLRGNFVRNVFFAWIIGVSLAVLLQILYTYWASGFLTASSYGEESFPHHGRYFLHVLFSIERGLFIYYPIVLLTLIMAAFVRRSFVFFLFPCLHFVLRIALWILAFMVSRWWFWSSRIR